MSSLWRKQPQERLPLQALRRRPWTSVVGQGWRLSYMLAHARSKGPATAGPTSIEKHTQRQTMCSKLMSKRQEKGDESRSTCWGSHFFWAHAGTCLFNLLHLFCLLGLLHFFVVSYSTPFFFSLHIPLLCHTPYTFPRCVHPFCVFFQILHSFSLVLHPCTPRKGRVGVLVRPGEGSC